MDDLHIVNNSVKSPKEGMKSPLFFVSGVWIGILSFRWLSYSNSWSARSLSTFGKLSGDVGDRSHVLRPIHSGMWGHENLDDLCLLKKVCSLLAARQVMSR